MQKRTQLTLDTKEIDEDNFTVSGVLSTDDKDTDGEVIDQDGWVLEDYIKNPVVLFGHKSDQPPVGKMVKIGYNDEGNLEGTIKFAAEEYDFAETIFSLYAGGYMRGFSAGFMNKDSRREDGTRVLTENVLKEVSTVPIPANANALAKAKEKGIDTEPVEKRVTKAFNLQTFEQETINLIANAYNADADTVGDFWQELGEPENLTEQMFADYLATLGENGKSGEIMNFFEGNDKSAVERLRAVTQVIRKEGRVLAQENRDAVERAIDALQEVIDRDDESRSQSADKSSESDGSPEGETPDAGQGGSKSEQLSVREINKRIRTLVGKKRDIKSSN